MPLRSHERYPEAIAEMGKALNLDPLSLEMNLFLPCLMEVSGDYDVNPGIAVRRCVTPCRRVDQGYWHESLALVLGSINEPNRYGYGRINIAAAKAGRSAEMRLAQADDFF